MLKFEFTSKTGKEISCFSHNKRCKKKKYHINVIHYEEEMYNVHEVKICSSQRLQTKLSATTTNMYDENDQFGYELGPLITGLIV